MVQNRRLSDKIKMCIFIKGCSVYLLRCAEDVSVVLAEPSYTSETSKCSRQLVPMQRPEVSPPQRKFLPRANSLLKHETKHKRGRMRACLMSEKGLKHKDVYKVCVCVYQCAGQFIGLRAYVWEPSDVTVNMFSL